MWTQRPSFGAWGDHPISEVRRLFRRELVDIVKDDPRVHNVDITEYTLQAVIFEHASWALGRRWRILVEDYIPRTDMKADLVVDRLTRDGLPDETTGTIAIEVKPAGGIERLGPDVEKLKRYVRRASNAVNCGILMYLSSRETDPAALRRMIGEYDRKIAVAWIRRQPDGLLL